MPNDPSLLQREIEQTKPFHSPQQEALLGVLKTADLIRRLITSTLEPYGVSMQQYNVLRILRGAAPDPLPTLTIRDRMIEQTPGITRLLDRLEARGWAVRERCATDRRQVLCRISDSGRQLLDVLDQPMARVEDFALSGLSREELEQATGLLDRIRAVHHSMGQAGAKAGNAA